MRLVRGWLLRLPFRQRRRRRARQQHKGEEQGQPRRAQRRQALSPPPMWWLRLLLLHGSIVPGGGGLDVVLMWMPCSGERGTAARSALLLAPTRGGRLAGRFLWARGNAAWILREWERKGIAGALECPVMWCVACRQLSSFARTRARRRCEESRGSEFN